MPDMPRLNFRRLMSEFRQVERALRDCRANGLLRCEPVEDNLLEWEADLVFPADSQLQKDLASLAESLMDPERSRVTIRARFPLEYPVNPPEVWIQRPRLRYQSAPVTLGGKVCNALLTDAGWLPSSSMLVVFSQLRDALMEAGARVDMTVSVMRGYPAAPLQLRRLSTKLFPEANSFVKHNMVALSAAEAEPFLGSLVRLEESDKIGLPFEFAEELYGRASRGQQLDLPLLFEVRSQLGRKIHCAIYDFIQGLPPTCILLPKWVMEDAFIMERESVRIRGVKLQLITFVKVQPHTVDFYKAVQQSGVEVNVLLTESLSRFSALTEDTSVPVEICGERHWVRVVALRPQGAVRIIDTDVQHHFEFQVDFDPAPDLEDEKELQLRQNQLLRRHRERQDQHEAARRSSEQRLSEFRHKHFLQVRERAFRAAGGEDGCVGEVELALRLPNGAHIRGKFSDGAPIPALLALALKSDWAEECHPWGVHAMTCYPRRILQESDAITKAMHRSTINVQVEREPDNLESFIWPSEAKTCADACGDLGAVSTAPSSRVSSAGAKACGSGSAGAKAIKHQANVVTGFRRLDRSHDGAVLREELGRVLRFLDERFWTDHCLDSLLAASGMTHRDQVFYEGFFEWVFADNTGCQEGDVVAFDDSGPPLPRFDEEALQRHTHIAFEAQRFIQAGVDVAEAIARAEAGDVLPPNDVTETIARQISAPQAAVSRERSGRSQNEAHDRQVQDVMDLTGVERDIVVAVLHETDWDTEAAVNLILDRLLEDD